MGVDEERPLEVVPELVECEGQDMAVCRIQTYRQKLLKSLK
jgi:hypothetical protein